MARTVKPDEFAAKRAEILDAAARLVFTKGFEKMSIRDILEELHISSGAFHHYFGSREALLEAFNERIRQESGKALLPTLQDPTLSALQKLQGFFDVLDQARLAQREYIALLGQVWYSDDNALVRDKVNAAVHEQRAPLIAEIVRQGIREGIFACGYPDQAGEILLDLLQGMGNIHARLFLAIAQGGDERACIAEIV